MELENSRHQTHSRHLVVIVVDEGFTKIKPCRDRFEKFCSCYCETNSIGYELHNSFVLQSMRVTGVFDVDYTKSENVYIS